MLRAPIGASFDSKSKNKNQSTAAGCVCPKSLNQLQMGPYITLDPYSAVASSKME